MRFLIVAGLAALAFAETKPSSIPINTWVREDIFAGFMVNDMPRFQNGMQKLEDILAVTPDAPEALSWRGGGKLYLAIRAHEAGEAEKFKDLYDGVRKDFRQARQAAEKSPQLLGAVFAITGGSYAVFGDRMPEELRREAWTAARDNYQNLKDGQKAFFHQLPPHMRGEVLAGLAQASQRLGEPPERWNALVAEIVTALPDTPYASRAKRWQDAPDVAGRTSLICQSCHDAGRLDAVKARQTAAAKPSAQ